MNKIKFYALWLIVMLSFVGTAYGDSDPISKMCEAMDGEPYYEMADGTRADCMTEVFVFKFTKPIRWADCIGQALHYSAVSGKRGVCVVLMYGRNDIKHAAKFKYTIEEHKLPIEAVFMKMGVDKEEKRFNM